MESLFVIIISSVCTSTFFISNFFMDFKKDRFLLASFELISAIIFITLGVCATWYLTMHQINTLKL